jgi:hypothetical protein
MNEANTGLPIEIERIEVDANTVQSVYQAGYSRITVKSIFGTKNSYSDLLSQIIKRKLHEAAVT